MIQKPNIQFSNRATSSLRDTSQNSHFFLTKNLDSRFGQNKAAYGSPGKQTIT